MRRTTRQTIVATLCAGAAMLLVACGSGTKTVTKASAPPLTQSTATQTQPAKTQKTSTQTTPTQTTSTSTSTRSTTTRAAPEPAFTQNESKTEGLSAASATVRAKGFTPNNTSDYHSDQALRVLVGTRTGSGDGYGQQAFFFVNGRYIGTDTKDTSATVNVVSQGDTEVTLGYPLYRSNDPLSSPSGGEAHVTFALNNGKLTPLGKIPPASSSSGLSRQ
ncbi:MAG: LppP/LprE family lipoprotein [Solirubrobacteraceae bacterium]